MAWPAAPRTRLEPRGPAPRGLRVTLQRRLSAYLLLLHLAFFGLTLWLYRERPLVVVAVEAVLVASAALGMVLLRSMRMTFLTALS